MGLPVIELSEKVAGKLMNMEVEMMDIEKIKAFWMSGKSWPFNQFLYEYPILAGITKEELEKTHGKKYSQKTIDAYNRKHKRKIQVESLSEPENDWFKITFWQYNKRQAEIEFRERLGKMNFNTEQETFTASHAWSEMGMMAIALSYMNQDKSNYEAETVREFKKSKKKSKGKKASSKIYITNKKYKIIDLREEKDKRGFTRHAEGWMVRGHWRTLKSGEKTWIKAHVKGDPEKVVSQTYKITGIEQEATP